MEGCTSWATVVNSTLSPKGGQTIGTHHIDIVNGTAGFVRVRLVDVLPARADPVITIKVLKI